MSNPFTKAVTPWMIKLVIAVVVVVWLASTLADAFISSYDPPQSIGLAFMAVLSAVLGSLAIKEKDDKPPRNSNGGSGSSDSNQ